MGKDEGNATREIITMPVKTRPHRQKSRRPSDLAFAYRLEKLMGDQLAVMRRLEKLIEEMEDEEDHRAIELAKKQNAGKPGIPWAEAKKRLGLD
jgi:hypothetical protein